MIFDWPKALRSALTSLRTLGKSDQDSADPRSGGKDLLSRLNHLSDLDTSSQCISVLHNIQTACIHLEFLQRGSCAEILPGSVSFPRCPEVRVQFILPAAQVVRIPIFPCSAEAFVLEAERYVCPCSSS